MKRFIPIALIGLSSCSPPAPPEPAVEVAVATTTEPVKPAIPKVVEPPPKTETPVVAVQPKKEEPPPPPKSFPFPTGEAGKLLPDVVRPPAPAMPKEDKFGAAPKPRPASKLSDPDSLPKLVHAATPLAVPRTAAGNPTAPPERVPLDLGFGAAAVPAKPALPEAPGIAVKARDVSELPDLVPLARQQPDRASLDDPTAEPGNAVIVTKSPFPAIGIAAFLRVAIPDPFELGDQVKAKVPPAAEPSPAPIVVNPQRVK